MILWNHIWRCLCFSVVLVLVVFGGRLSDSEVPVFSERGVPFLEQYCLDCHSGEQPAAEVSLDVYHDTRSLIENRDVWERVLDMIISGHMPPAEAEQPPLPVWEQFVDDIESIFEESDRTAPPDPGRVTVRRLNRVEYRNTVRDLLGVDFDPTVNFPADDVGHGFDNIGDVLTMSPLLMERYLEAAEAIATRVILVELPPPSKRSRNGRDLLPRHDDVPYENFRVLDPMGSEPWQRGPFWTEGENLKFFPDIELNFRATLYAEAPEAEKVEVALFIEGAELVDYSPAEEVAALVGFEGFRYADAAAPEAEGVGDSGASVRRVKVLEVFEVTRRDRKKPQTISTRVSRVAGVARVGIAMVRRADGSVPSSKLHIRRLGSEGPLDTRPASHRAILACTPDVPQVEQTREVLTRLLRGGYRRPPTESEVTALTQFVESVQASGASWEAGIQSAVKVLLCSPKFLFRLELDDRPQGPDPYPIDPFQLASRLSYFLWSSMPDEELLALAEKNQLTANLEAQVKRMLADPKASAFARNFGTQWLQIQRLTAVAPDSKRFPTFTMRLREAMQKETELFLESVFREDRSVLVLLDADYTFLNKPLANHYGIKDTQGNWMGQAPSRPGGEAIAGAAFQRVTLQGATRGGILTHASVLTVTSNPTRTSPVKRGRWVLEQLLGAPPPPPPPDVPELEEEGEKVHGRTLRERLEQHRDDPACANCHAKMDPIGFALENYDAIGAFRRKDGELAIDATGELPDGTTFQGIADLKRILTDRKQNFARCLTEKLLTYALGRGLAYYDRATVEHIVAQLEAGGYKSSILITEIAKSDPFRLRRGTKDD